MKTLKYKKTIIISPCQPYNFKATIFKPSHFPITTEIFDNNKFYFSMNWKNDIYGIKLESIEEEKILISIFYQKELTNDIFIEIINEIKYRFDMNSSLKEFIKLAEASDILNKIEKKWHGMRPRCAYSLYELLCITLVLQNAQVSRSISMLKTMLKTYGQEIIFDNKQLSVFWLPKELVKISDSELRSLKIGYRAKTFLRQANFFQDNKNFEIEIRKLNKTDTTKKLLEIYGIGNASVWYLLFENLHYYDAFDYISPWENKILSKILYDNLDVEADIILSYAKKHWSGYRMLAIHYIFENIFWMRREKDIDWLNKLIRM